MKPSNQKPPLPPPVLAVPTYDYSLFYSHEAQRRPKPAHLARVIESLKQWGFIPSQCVTVIASEAVPGKKYKIIDGHTRFTAAQMIGSYFYFMVLDERFQKAVAILNIQKEWNKLNYAHMYHVEGSPDYSMLVKYVDEEGIGLSIAASLLYGEAAGSHNAIRLVGEGSFVVRNTDRIEKLVSIRRQFQETVPEVKKQLFMEAFCMMLWVPNFDIDRFRRRLTNNYSLLRPTPNDRKEWLKRLEEIYNAHTKAADCHPIAHEAQRLADMRNIMKRNQKEQA